MGKIKHQHVLIGYWLLGVALALVLPPSIADSSQSATYLPRLFDSLSARSIEPNFWRSYFFAMMIAGLLALPALGYAVWKELGAPKVKRVLLLATIMIMFGGAILFWLLSINVPVDRPLPKLGAMLESRIGLAALGSLFLTGILVLVLYTLVAPLLAVARR